MRPGVIHTVLCLCLALPVHAEVPLLLGFQGRLEDPAGTPMTGATSLTFDLYTVEFGGSSFHTETDQVTLDQTGVFSTTLGDSPAPGLDPADFGAQVWVGVTPWGGDPLSPRLPLRAAPYALQSAQTRAMLETYRHGAQLTWVTTQAIDIEPGRLGFSDGKLRETTQAVTFDLANSSGPLGLATGTGTSDTWYYLYAVPDPGEDTRFTVVGAVEAPIEVGGTGPAGYPIHRFVGSFRTIDDGSVLEFTRSGPVVLWGQGIPWMQAADPAPDLDQWIAQDASAGLPETASIVCSSNYFDAYLGDGLLFRFKPSSHDASTNELWIFGDHGSSPVVNQLWLPTRNRQFYWMASLNSGTNAGNFYRRCLFVGYREDLERF